MTDPCGYVKESDGEPCQLPGTREDGRCHHHTDAEEQKRGGRPSLLDDYEDDILTGARQGMTLEGCARLAGIDESTLHRWIDKHEDFRKSLKRARAEGELRHLQSVNDKGSQFILERSFGYVKTEKKELEHSGNAGINIFTSADDGSD